METTIDAMKVWGWRFVVGGWCLERFGEWRRRRGRERLAESESKKKYDAC
jgi:hypothetical protein